MGPIALNFDPFAFAVALMIFGMTVLQLYWTRSQRGHTTLTHLAGQVSENQSSWPPERLQ